MNYSFAAVVLLFIILQYSKAKNLVVLPSQQVENHAHPIYSTSHTVSIENMLEWLRKNKTTLIIKS